MSCCYLAAAWAVSNPPVEFKSETSLESEEQRRNQADGGKTSLPK